MNYFIFPFFFYIFFCLPRYLVQTGYIRLPEEFDLHTKRKTELIYLIVILGLLFALIESEKNFTASPVTQVTGRNIVKVFEDIFDYSYVTRPVLAVVMPYLFPVLYSYVLSFYVFAAMIVVSSSAPMFTILVLVIFILSQVFLFGIIKKRFEQDLRVRIGHAAVGYCSWLAMVYAIPAIVSL